MTRRLLLHFSIPTLALDFLRHYQAMKVTVPRVQTIVIIGASTNAGKTAIQYAKLAHIGTIIGTASASREKEFRDTGATHVIDRRLPQSDIVAEAHAAAGGAEKINHIYGCASWTCEFATELHSPNVPTVLLALHPIDADTEKGINPKRPLYKAKSVNSTSQGLGALREEFWRILPGWAEKGLILCPEVSVLGGLDG